jgi:hypothetical protein
MCPIHVRALFTTGSNGQVACEFIDHTHEYVRENWGKAKLQSLSPTERDIAAEVRIHGTL